MESLLSPTEIFFIVFAVVFIVLDVVCGILTGFLKKQLSSKKSREGVQHKTGLVLVVILGIVCHLAQQFIDLGIHVPLLTLVCSYVIFTEIISICENIGELNPGLKTTKFMQLFAFAYDGKEGISGEPNDGQPAGTEDKEDER